MIRDKKITIRDKKYHEIVILFFVSNGPHRITIRYTGADFSSMPLPHSTHMSAGGVAEICRLNSMVWRLPWDRLLVALSKATYAYFFTFYQTARNKR